MEAFFTGVGSGAAAGIWTPELAADAGLDQPTPEVAAQC
jgi:hypothetical protein